MNAFEIGATIAQESAPLDGQALSAPEYGAMGAFLAIVIAGFYWLLRREAARGDRLEDELRAVNRARIEKEIPVIEQCVGVMSEVTDVMRQVSYELRRRGDS